MQRARSQTIVLSALTVDPGSVVFRLIPIRSRTASTMWPAFEQALARYHELEQQLADPAVVADRSRFTRIAKEHGSLAKMVKPYLEYKQARRRRRPGRGAGGRRSRPGDAAATPRRNWTSCAARQQALQNRLEDLLLVEGEDFGSIIMEIRAGTGGDEAALFAGDLYDMYTHYARDQGWKVEDISFSPGEQGGFKEIVFSVTGDDVFQHLRYESGGHRVQRVPKTETQGRIHTSAATVAVLPEPDEVQVEIKDAGHRMGDACAPAAPAASTSTRPKRRPHLVQEGHAGRDGSQVPGRAQPAQELRPGHAHPAQPALRTAAAEAAPASGPSSAAP